ncbi:MAG: helix-turn-helix transcriptional regulator [Lentisphaeria bacterium]|jgi:ribosome-binding protein aMBF1 (putative translation factor)|nr:helix-turn-helix transcriptional regulator [Lentisphaeria bacterium]
MKSKETEYEHAAYLTDEEIEEQLRKLGERIKSGIPDEDELERDAYFNDPANADEVNAMFERFRLREELYKARHEAGLSQAELAKRMGTSQTYIAALERGRKNVTFDTLSKFARACGKSLSIKLA